MSGQQAKATATVVELPRAENTLGPISVSCGANEQTFTTFEPGVTLQEVGARLKEVLNIPEGAKMFAGGTEVGDDYMLQPGDRVEFVRQAGEKA